VTEALLVCEAVTKRFGGLTALRDVSLVLPPGYVLGVIGPNGAGKSTLLNLVTGIFPVTSGRMLFQGRDIRGLPPHRIVAQGIARTFQTSRLFSDLSVLDNVIIGMHTKTRTSVLDALFRRGAARRELEAAAETAGQLLRALSDELYEQRFRPAAELAQADRRRLEIARALASGPSILLLDEPSAGMDERETDALVADLRALLAARPGLSLIVVEHDMRLVEALTHSVLVLDHGVKIAEGSFAEVAQIASVQEAYLGKRADHAAAR
jgi:branched-chain amino acid transport system ATP-binding protein